MGIPAISVWGSPHILLSKLQGNEKSYSKAPASLLVAGLVEHCKYFF